MDDSASLKVQEIGLEIIVIHPIKCSVIQEDFRCETTVFTLSMYTYMFYQNIICLIRKFHTMFQLKNVTIIRANKIGYRFDRNTE